MKYLKTFESRYNAENIDKKYYVWQVPIPYKGGKKMGIIEIISIKKNKIRYEIIRRTNGYLDFFHDKNSSDNYGAYDVNLSYWKRNMIGRLLFSTDDKQSAIDFYNMYEDSKKYNI